MNKQQIKFRFDAASASYDNVAVIQMECGKVLTSSLLELLPTFQPVSILDLGTGTGYIAELLLPIFPKASYILNDIAPNMLNEAKKKFSSNDNISFDLSDFEINSLSYHDLIVSNMALQWVDDLENTITKLYNHSKILAFSCLLDGTFKEWHNIIVNRGLASPIKKYPSIIEIEKIFLSLPGSTYHIKVKTFTINFQNAKSFMLYLKKLGASKGQTNFTTKQVIDIITNCTDFFEITYNVLFVIISKKMPIK